MKLKKNPKANLENYSKFFMQLGLVMALLVCLLSIEFKTYDRTISTFGDLNMDEVLEEDIPITERIEPVKPPPPPPPAPEVIQVVEDKAEVEETVLESTETDETEKVEVEEIIEVIEEEEIGDVPFAIIENAPVYPGCEGKSKAEQKKCLSQSITKLVYKKFNVDLASDLGLTPGKKRIFVMFKIDKTGRVVDIRARAPHKRLEKEAKRVVSLIPRMTPGKQRGRAVGVKYSLPIVFNVQD
ncbi:MAG: energy transducer TonB [Flavobacteriaceae bacterium]|nr:energy transducer TonB [Flavobacteriaceae bacterium]